MDDEGGSPMFRKKSMKDRTSCLVTGIGIGMLLALLVNSILVGLFTGVALGLVIEAVTRRGMRPRASHEKQIR